MTDEEKKAIAYLNFYIERDVMYEDTHYEQIKTILNLIEKRTKEIEELKEGFKIQEHNYQVAMEEIEQRWKDKIKAKIEEYLEYDKKYKRYMKDGRECFTMEYYYAKMLRSLLEKE